MIGKTISHYKILEMIGGGGMGVVYKAEDLKLKRVVALKFLPPSLTSDTESKKRFIQEAQAASSFQHNNICTVHDIDETDDGQMFICMDNYEGETLKEKIGRGPLSLEEAVDITVQVARGLAEAHKHGVIHRDIKPANILITKGGVAKILDFGLAKLVGGSMLTSEGTTLGTAAYMSPEQLLGGTVDARSDIFAVGVIMIEMLTQRLPFKGEHAAALMYSIINDEAMSLKELRKDVPEKVVEFCERCLQKDVNARPRTMDDAIRILGITEKFKVVMVGHWHRWSWRMRAGVVASVAVPLAISLWLARPLLIPSSQPEITRPVIAVLPFRNLTGRAETAEWPSTIQNMIINSILGSEGLAAIDQYTLSSLIGDSIDSGDEQRDRMAEKLVKAGKAQYVVDGSIRYSGNRYVIKYTLFDPSAGGLLTTPKAVTIAGEDSLSSGVRILSNEILSYLQVKVVSASSGIDPRPWIAGGSQNIKAVQELLDANQLIFNGMRSAAPAHLRRAIQLDSTYIIPRIGLISSLVANGNLKEAKAQYETLLRFEPNANPFETALINWAGAYIAQDLVAEIRYLKMALEYSPGNQALLYTLAAIDTYANDYQGAIDALLPAIKTNWQFSEAHYLVAYCYDQLKEFAKAKEVMEHALTLRWVDHDIYGLLSIYALRDKDTTKAREYENAYLQAGRAGGLPEHQMYATLASNNLSEGFCDRAVKYYELAASLEPRNAAYRDELGETFFLLGNREAAENEFLQAVRLDPSQAHPHLRLGELYETKKDTIASIRQYNDYLKLDSVSNSAVEVRQHLFGLETRSKNIANLRNASRTN